MSRPWNFPVSIAPPETTIVGRPHAARAHQQRGGGFVATAKQYDTVHRVGAVRFLDIHAHQVAVQASRSV